MLSLYSLSQFLGFSFYRIAWFYAGVYALRHFILDQFEYYF